MIGLLLIGMPGLEKRLAAHPQIYSRIGFAHRYHPLSDEELAFVLTRDWKRLGLTLDLDDFTDHEAVAAISRITRGNFRILHRLFTVAEDHHQEGAVFGVIGRRRARVARSDGGSLRRHGVYDFEARPPPRHQVERAQVEHDQDEEHKGDVYEQSPPPCVADTKIHLLVSAQHPWRSAGETSRLDADITLSIWGGPEIGVHIFHGRRGTNGA